MTKSNAQVRDELAAVYHAVLKELPQAATAADPELADAVDGAITALQNVMRVAAINAHRARIEQAERSIRSSKDAIERLRSEAVAINGAGR